MLKTQFDPKKFAENLKKSTLDPDEQQAILDLLPNLSLEQIDELDEIFKKDVNAQDKIFAQAQLKADIIVNDFKNNVEEKRKRDL